MHRYSRYIYISALTLMLICAGGVSANVSPTIGQKLYGEGPANDILSSGAGAFAHTDAIALKTQKLTVSLSEGGGVNIRSDYQFEVLKEGPPIEVVFLTDTGVMASHEEYNGSYLLFLDSFDVTVRGEKLEPGLFETAFYDNNGIKSLGIRFPIAFGASGACPVTIEYSYEYEGGWYEPSAPDWSSRIPGLEYQFGPARYWAGEIASIEVSLILDRIDKKDLTVLAPPDFTFTDTGCLWQWGSLTDDEIEHSVLRIGFHNPGYGSDRLTRVVSSRGCKIYAVPDPDGDVTAQLKKGERIYVYYDDETFELNSWSFKQGRPIPDTYWLKCRLLDNSEGYVMERKDDYYYLDCLGYAESKH